MNSDGSFWCTDDVGGELKLGGGIEWWGGRLGWNRGFFLAYSVSFILNSDWSFYCTDEMGEVREEGSGWLGVEWVVE